MTKMKLIPAIGVQLLLLAAGPLLMFSCSQNTSPGNVTICLSGSCQQGGANTVGIGRPLPEGPNPPTPTATPVPPLEARQVLLKLKENCHGCHGLGKDKSSFWQTPPDFEKKTEAELKILKAELLDKGEMFDEADERFVPFETHISSDANLDRILTQIELDQFSVEVFKTIENSIVGHADSMPMAMRPHMPKDARESFLAFVDNLIADGEMGPSSVKPMAHNEAKSWCVGCHSPGGSGAKNWDRANGTEMEWKDFASQIRNSVQDGRMPISRPKGKDKEEWLGVLAFFQKRFPTIVSDARAKYHGDKLELGVPLDLSFKCNSFKNGREFINELTMDALDRPPTFEELELVGKGDKPVSKQLRQKLVAKISNEWQAEFLGAGIKKFAEKVSLSNIIRTSTIIDDVALRNDIALEFYQYLKNESDKPYRSVFLSKNVYATKLTAPFYGEDCMKATADLSAGEFKKCEMNELRKGFFTTLGFLGGRSSSMFQENNNYGRVAAMNEVLRGEPLRANTAGETGETINPLPSCLVSSDTRVLVQGDSFAPRGTITVPASGNFCQGCHIRRNLAAGSIAFRPFGPMGEIITYQKMDDLTKAVLSSLSGPERILRKFIFDAVSNDTWKLLNDDGPPSSMNIAKFRTFLDIGTEPGQEKGCIVDGPNDNSKDVTSVADLVEHMIQDDRVLPRGLARIIPRALSSKNSTNPEVIEAVTRSWTESRGNLTAAIQAYFSTDTYACRFNSEDSE